VKTLNVDKICNFGTGVSDVHNFIGVQLDCELPKLQHRGSAEAIRILS
jgi:hypothetical protein